VKFNYKVDLIKTENNKIWCQLPSSVPQ